MAYRRSCAYSILVLFGLLYAVAASAEAVPVASLDPSDDPWLAQEGPAVVGPDEIPQEQVVLAWQQAGSKAHDRVAALRRVRLELGLGDLRAPAAVIASDATEDDARIFSGFARELAPGVPAVQFDHAVTLGRSGDTGAAVLAFGSTVWSVLASLTAQLWLFENIAVLLLVVVLGASLAFVVLAALQVAPHAAHDLGDLFGQATPHFARYAALGALVLAPLVVGEGVLGVTLALFTVAYAYGRSRTRNALAMAAVLLLIGLHPLAQIASVATGLLEHDPIARSALAVVAGTENAADVDRLEAAGSDDPVAAHALVYRDRRYGLVEGSRERLDAILERSPTDVVALANRGNIEKRRGNTALAINYYERASAGEDDPSLLFDLSQAYASAFRMEEYEATLSRAQRVGDTLVADLSSLDDAELVADLGFPSGLLIDRMKRLALSDHGRTATLSAIAPGRLGGAWFVTAGAFALSVLLCQLFAGRWDHASLCARCGHRICTRCEDTVWSEELCEDCHHLFKYPEATDSSLRMARLQELSRREARIDRIVLAVSVAIPGVAGFAARRPDFALFGLLLFAWVAVWAAWPTGIFEDPMLLGGAAVLCFALPGVLAALAYLSLLFASLIVRKNR